MKLSSIIPTITCFLLVANINGLAQNLVSGPMLGYNEMRETAIWVQLDTEAEVSIEYNSDSSRKKQSEVIKTKGEDGNTARFILSALEPDTHYTYKVLINGKATENEYDFTTQKLWQYREDPPPLTFAVGSCVYINEAKYDRPGDPYGGNYEIFESIVEKDPDFMLWLGDNIYLREVDWNIRSGFVHRYSDMRRVPELQRLLSACHHYAIWDDHDFGPNDSDGSFIHKDVSKEVFSLFWANNNYGLPETEGITSQFQYGDLDFFLLDNRTFRVDYQIIGGQPTVLGDEQISWLIRALKFSKSKFKFVCMGGQFLNDAELYENYANWEEERQQIIDLIDENEISGVIFLTGDRHCASMSELELSNGGKIIELTASPLTSKAYDNCNEGNSLMVEGTCFGNRNFALINATGSWKERTLSVELYDHEGNLIWTRIIDGELNIEEEE